MKSTIAWGTALIAALALLATAALAHGNDHGNITEKIGDAHVTIDYNRPSLKGRDPLSLIQPGKVWRMGSDAPTTLETDHDIMVGGTKIAPGKYILLARFDGPGKWTLVVSKKPYNAYTADAMVAETPMTVDTAMEPAETVTITFVEKKGTHLVHVAWGKLLLIAEITPER